ncbi:MAG: electron transport complex subunit RsxC [Clostridia bacterium]|nr:electron transport complex subunit RsxC [Clostridia bacterium]
MFSEKPYRTDGGVSLPHLKETALSPTVKMPPPAYVRLPMQMHIGAPCAPCVKVGDKVLVGQKIGDSEKPFSVPIHASVSGEVTDIAPLRLAGGAVVETVVIASDGEMRQIEHSPISVENEEELIRAVRECGLVGLGGAGFPTHIKLRPGDKKIDTLLINGAECEPYLTSDNREILENSWDVMSGVYLVKKMLGIHRVFICIEKNKPRAIEVLRKIADSSVDYNDEVRVLPLPTSYPQGAEKVLIKSATGREVPEGKLPADVGCIVMNITSISVLSRYIKTGMPLVSKRLTVEGGAVKNKQNVIVPLGTSVSDLLAFVGVSDEDVGKVMFGGPMMGVALESTDVPILKNNNGVVVLTRKEATLGKTTACIHCGRCVSVCPMRLFPLRLEKATERKDTEALERLSQMTCMECGSCAYACPAKRPLVQSMRLGKALLREKNAKKG